MLSGSLRSEASCPPQVFRDDQGRQTTALEEDCPAPFEGILIDRQKVRELGQRAEAAEKTLELTLTSTRAYWAERMRYRDEVHAIELDAAEAKTQAALDALPPFYERPGFVIPVTVIVTVAAIFGAAELVKVTSSR